MKKEYLVYTSSERKGYIFSLEKLEERKEIRRKMTPHEARIKAIKYILNKEIDINESHEDVKKFVEENIYSTKKWGEYQESFTKYKSKLITVLVNYEFQCKIEIELQKDITEKELFPILNKYMNGELLNSNLVLNIRKKN